VISASPAGMGMSGPAMLKPSPASRTKYALGAAAFLVQCMLHCLLVGVRRWRGSHECPLETAGSRRKPPCWETKELAMSASGCPD
jgi:hypothetical protein